MSTTKVAPWWHFRNRFIDDDGVVNPAAVVTQQDVIVCYMEAQVVAALGELDGQSFSRERTAEIIADAGTTYHETGKTPSELAAEVASLKRRADCFDELVAELSFVLDWAVLEKAPLRDREIKSIRAVLAKAAGETK